MNAPSMAAGGATRATPRDNSILELNPAAMSMVPRYTAEVGFQYYGLIKSKRLVTSAMDSRTSPFALGVSYTVDWWEPPFDPAVDLAWFTTTGEDPRDKRNTHRILISAAYGLLDRRVNIGVTARILRYDRDIRADDRKVTVDVGGAFLVAPNVALFVVGNNLVPTHLASDPTTLAAGLGLTLGVLRVEADAIVDFTSDADRALVDLNAGAELRLLQQIVVSAGFASQRQFTDLYVSWGGGWSIPRFGIFYAMRIEAGEMDHRTRADVEPGWDRLLHSLSVQVAF